MVIDPLGHKGDHQKSVRFMPQCIMTIRVVVAFMCGFIVVIAYVAYLYIPVCCRTYTYRRNSGTELIRDLVGKKKVWTISP